MTAPRVRFEGCGGEWEERKFSEVFETITDYVAAGSFAALSENVKYKTKPDYAQLVRTIDLKSNFTNKEFVYIDKHAFDYLWRVNLDKECLILPNIGNCGEVYYVTPDLLPYERNALAPNAIYVRSDSNNNSFFAYDLTSNDFQDKLSLIISPNGQTKFNKTELKDISVNVPPLPEQQKIGALFRTIDALLAARRKERAQLEATKRALLDRMFPREGEDAPRLRFAGFSGNWERRKLGDISEKVTEKNIDMLFTEVFTNSAEFGIITQRDFFEHDVAKQNKINNYYVVRPDDFIYNPRISTSAPVGPINRNKLERTGVMSPLYIVFRTFDIDYSYLEYFFKNNSWHSFMFFNGDSGARSDRFTIRNEVFFEMPISCPSIAEQQKIGAFFRAFDDLLALHARRIEKLGALKAACLGAMFC